MANIVQNKKTFVQSVATLVMIDLGIQSLVFGETRTFATDLIQYDTATVEGVSPAYNSFANSANVVKKGTKTIVTIGTPNYNDSISKGVIDANVAQFGENEYGDSAGINPTMQSALDGVGKLHLNALSGRKALFYEALTTHKIAGGYDGVSGKEDIVFGVPANNLELFDGATLKYWSNSDSTPLTDIKRAYTEMKVKPTYVIMGDVEYSNFINNIQVITDANSTNKAKNFTLNESVDIEADFFNAGRIFFEGVTLDLFVERGRAYDSAGSASPFMQNYVVLTNRTMGSTYFAGIPVAVAGGVQNISAEFDVDEQITINPPQHLLIYRSAPLGVIRNGEAIFTMRTEA